MAVDVVAQNLQKVTSTNIRKNISYVVTPRCAPAVISAVVLRRPTKEYTHPYSMMHRRLPTAGNEVAPHYHQLLKNKKQNNFLYVDYVCLFICLCVIQHRNRPLRSTILNARGTNASPDGLCTRTHTKKAFSCCFCCNSFRVDRAGAATCVYSEAGPRERSDRGRFLGMPGPFLKSLDSWALSVVARR